MKKIYVLYLIPIVIYFFTKDNLIFFHTLFGTSIITMNLDIFFNGNYNMSLKVKKGLFTSLFLIAIHCLFIWFCVSLFGSFFGMTMDKILSGIINFNVEDNLNAAQIYIWIGLCCSVVAYIFYFAFIKEQLKLNNSDKKILKASVKNYNCLLLPISFVYLIFLLIFYIITFIFHF